MLSPCSARHTLQPQARPATDDWRPLDLALVFLLAYFGALCAALTGASYLNDEGAVQWKVSSCREGRVLPVRFGRLCWLRNSILAASGLCVQSWLAPRVIPGGLSGEDPYPCNTYLTG